MRRTRWLQRLLPFWFAALSLVHFAWIAGTGSLGLDARIYHRAAVALLSGADPWNAAVTVMPGHTFHFAGLPPSILPFVPTAWLSEGVVAALWAIGSYAAGAWIIRRLRLDWWWILFPPLVMGILSANPGVVVLALLLTRWPPAEGLGAALKVYALLPLAAQHRWRGPLLFVGICVASLPLWLTWDPGRVTGRLFEEAAGGVGATAYWWLVPLTILALAVVGRYDLRAAAFLAIPGVWPAAQYHYAIMALPVISPVTAAVFAVPLPGMIAAAVLLHAWLLLRERVRPGLSRRCSRTRRQLE